MPDNTIIDRIICDLTGSDRKDREEAVTCIAEYKLYEEPEIVEILGHHLQNWNFTYRKKPHFQISTPIAKLFQTEEGIEKCSDMVSWPAGALQIQVQDEDVYEIPTGIYLMPKLQTISFHGTNLRIVPDTIGKLENLRWLLLLNNPISHLPETLAECSKLDWIAIHEDWDYKASDWELSQEERKKQILDFVLKFNANMSQAAENNSDTQTNKDDRKTGPRPSPGYPGL